MDLGFLLLFLVTYPAIFSSELLLLHHLNGFSILLHRHVPYHFWPFIVCLLLVFLAIMILLLLSLLLELGLWLRQVILYLQNYLSFCSSQLLNVLFDFSLALFKELLIILLDNSCWVLLCQVGYLQSQHSKSLRWCFWFGYGYHFLSLFNQIKLRYHKAVCPSNRTSFKKHWSLSHNNLKFLELPCVSLREDKINIHYSWQISSENRIGNSTYSPVERCSLWDCH